MPKKGLGRGLDALISRDALSRSEAVVQIGVQELAPNPYQPRTHLAEQGLDELAQSIRRHGVIQPLVVRPKDEGFEVVAGERRWRAAQLAGLETVPCVVRQTTDEESVVFALVENLQREDINAVDAAEGYRRLLTEFHMTQSELAEQVGRSRSAIANTLRLLDLPAEVRDSIRTGEITEGHGRALLLAAPDGEKLLGVWKRVCGEGLSVRDTERLARAAVEGQARPGADREAAARDPNVLDVEERLQRALGTRVQVRPRGKRGGTVVIRYRDLEELDTLVAMAEGAAPAEAEA
jgi:ParB family chromosome partitioning protein